MPQHKSAIKRLKTNKRNHDKNMAVKSRVRRLAKSLRTASAAGDNQKAEELFKVVAPLFDRAVSKGVLHKRTAARNKSRLAAVVQKTAAAAK
jgi:small subunit ribosomal protein S20